MLRRLSHRRLFSTGRRTSPSRWKVANASLNNSARCRSLRNSTLSKASHTHSIRIRNSPKPRPNSQTSLSTERCSIHAPIPPSAEVAADADAGVPSRAELMNIADSHSPITTVRLDVEQHQLFRAITNMSLLLITLKHKLDGRFLEKCSGENLENCVERLRQSQLFFDDGDQDINSHSNPDLGLHTIGRRAEKTFDAQVLFDPFE